MPGNARSALDPDAAGFTCASRMNKLYEPDRSESVFVLTMGGLVPNKVN
jgi:hypothetical protein